jgi:hypothetical protein
MGDLMALEYDESIRPNEGAIMSSTTLFVIIVICAMYFALSGLLADCCPEGQTRVMRKGQCLCEDRISRAD